jgi:hypothetical protein
MIKLIFLLIGFSCACNASTTDSLLELAKQHDIKRYEFALEKGVKIIPTSDGRSFCLLWKPEGFDTMSSRPIVATIHGHGSFAFDEFFLWYNYCKERNYALIALQWYFGGDERNSNYYQPNEMYPIFENVLRNENIKPGFCLFHGFSRGSANTYALAAFDTHTGNRFFGMIISNSGSAEDDYPANKDILNGKFGTLPYSNTHWVLFCGVKDDNIHSDCSSMEKTEKWVEALGGKVELFIKDPSAGHGGFHMNSKNTNLALDKFSEILFSK